MPLIVMVGIPSSGKTTRALEIKKYFEAEHKVGVLILNEENLQMDKNKFYKSSLQPRFSSPHISLERWKKYSGIPQVQHSEAYRAEEYRDCGFDELYQRPEVRILLYDESGEDNIRRHLV